MKDVLDTLERWAGDGLRFATATVVKTERSAPRGPGAVLAVSEKARWRAPSPAAASSRPSTRRPRRARGGPPRLVSYGIADEEAFEVGLPCGGTVHIFSPQATRDLVARARVAPIARSSRWRSR